MNQNKFFIPVRSDAALDVTGVCQVLGAAYHENALVGVAISGAHTSVEATKASLSLGKGLKISALPGGYYSQSVYGATGGYESFTSRDEQLRDDHMLIVARSVFNYVSESTYTYLWTTGETEHVYEDTYAIHKFGERMRQMLNIPYFDAWSPVLLKEAVKVRKCVPVSYNNAFGKIWALPANPGFWTDSIVDALTRKHLQFPALTTTTQSIN